jgi:DNA topoisomerase-1
VLSGRYGPYVKHGEVNATLPRAKDPATLSLNEAVELIAERLAKGPSNKAKGRRKTDKGRSKAGQDAAVAKPEKSAKGKVKKADKATKPTKGKPKKVSGTREAAE